MYYRRLFEQFRVAIIDLFFSMYWLSAHQVRRIPRK
jgi:hypothetical protein